MSKANRSEDAAIPPHMLENPVSNAQRKAFAKVKRAEAKEEAKAEAKATPKKKGAE